MCKETHWSAFFYNFTPSACHQTLSVGNTYNALKCNTLSILNTHTKYPTEGSEADGDEGEVSSSELVVYFPEDGHMG